MCKMKDKDDIEFLDRVLRERYEFHLKLFERFIEEGGSELQIAVQYNLKEEIQNIAAQVLGYYLKS